eukprot:gb/GECG01005753.1/.p1 GENE.gb/GECG01005753.1/~~gb/GECG01005753.1/.p1  ORF type:complete len:545 (+),score=49.92 gb/GECG01005753.1/:1-1635(+)
MISGVASTVKEHSTKSFCKDGLAPNKWVLFVAGGFQALTSSVVIFGWPNIEPVLTDKGVFLDRCDPKDVGGSNGGCDAQIEALALIFTVASAVSFAFNLVNGLILDRFGLKATVTFGLSLFSLGLVILGLGSQEILINVDYDQPRQELATKNPSASEAAVFFIGFSLIGAAAVATLHPMFSIGNLFPKIGNSVVTTLNGCADSSAVMFLFVRLLYFSGGIALHHILYGYVIGPVFVCILFTLFFWPRWPFKSKHELAIESKPSSAADDKPTKGEQAAQESTKNDGMENSEDRELVQVQVEEGSGTRTDDRSSVAFGTDSGEPEEDKDTYTEMIERQYPHLGKTFREQVLTFRFLGGAAFTWINILKFNYFFVTLNIVLEEMGDTDGTFTEVFGWISLGGLGAVFVTGTIIERYGLVGGFWGSNISGVLLSILSLIPVLELQILTFIVFVIFRSFLFSIAATFFASEFGIDNFGKLMGITFCIGGGFGFLSQPLLIMGLDSFDRDFTVPGLIVLALTLIQTSFPVAYTYYKSKAMETTRVKEENR